MFDIRGKTLKPVTDARSSDELERWWTMLVEEGRAKKAIESLQRSMTSTEIEALGHRSQVKHINNLSRWIFRGIRVHFAA